MLERARPSLDGSFRVTRWGRGTCASLLLAVLALVVGCGRFQPLRPYQVERSGDPEATYQVVREVLAQQSYKPDDEIVPGRSVRVAAHVGAKNAAQRSWITVEVTPRGEVRLVPSGGLVQGNTLHRRLAQEVQTMQQKIGARLAIGARAATVASPSSPTAEPSGSKPKTLATLASAGGMPRAWNERPYDPKTWGPGEFTCVPVKLTPDSRQLELRLSDGSNADVAISVAYAPALCRSPSACSLPDGCPALGLGDTDQVTRLAERLSEGAVGSQATLLQNGKPVANIDLRAHGSVAQALTQLDRL